MSPPHCFPPFPSLSPPFLPPFSPPLPSHRYLSDVTEGDDMDLRWAIIGHKMQQAGYKTHWYGKGHTGYKSWQHLPQQLGFDDFVGFLGGAQDHFASKRWVGNCPFDDFNETYSADLYGSHALRTLEEYDADAPDAKPLFFYLPWQNVHAPYQAPHDWTGDVLRGMLQVK